MDRNIADFGKLENASQDDTDWGIVPDGASRHVMTGLLLVAAICLSLSLVALCAAQ